MKKILFLIHDLGAGGAEKVLVNLVNHLDRSRFDITLIALFGGGVNEQFLKRDIHYRALFGRTVPGNSRLMKLLSPAALHKWFIREHFDIEVAYLEGPSARIISGCKDEGTATAAWIHGQMHTKERAAASFRSYAEAAECYGHFRKIICVSEGVRENFRTVFPDIQNSMVLYNTNETASILAKRNEQPGDNIFSDGEIRICGVGKLVPGKGFDRLARIHAGLAEEGFPVHTYLLGEGPERERIEQYVKEKHLEDSFTLLGYQTNPYQYIGRCDLFVCTSLSEGFSTAATEALILGNAVVTAPVSGMREMLGENNEYGIIAEDGEEALYREVRGLVSDPEKLKDYKQRAEQRGRFFSTENTVRAVEEMLEHL